MALLSSACCLNQANAQNYEDLQLVEGYSAKVYYSKGFDERAKDITMLTSAAIDYHSALLGFKPSVTVLVLSKDDWNHHTSFPIYGMAHYKDDKTLVVASSDNDFWKSFIPPLEQLPGPIASQIKKVYKTKSDSLSMQPFFDLLALHELGHAFHMQGGLNMQRKWTGELFCNLFVHTYIAEKEPHLLPALELFPQMVVNSGTSGFEYTTLAQLEENYELIAKEHPRNYGWYQCRWHMAAKNIYDSGGSNVMVKLWNALKEKKSVADDKIFADFLLSKVHSAVAAVMQKW